MIPKVQGLKFGSTWVMYILWLKHMNSFKLEFFGKRSYVIQPFKTKKFYCSDPSIIKNKDLLWIIR